MREKKFRVFDKISKKMIYFDINDPANLWFLINFDYEAEEVMQYTWLKDKNGKECYEWDIIKKWNYIGVIEYCNIDVKYLIVWKWKTANKTMWADWLWSTYPTPYFDIIWNKYENAELIEKESV